MLWGVGSYRPRAAGRAAGEAVGRGAQAGRRGRGCAGRDGRGWRCIRARGADRGRGHPGSVPVSELIPDVRRDPRMLDALRRTAPGTAMRQGINDILRGSEGALIVIGEPAELSFLFSGGIRLDQAFSPYLLYELAKMDGAIILNSSASRIVYANVQLMPDPTIPSAETGTRHRTAERVAKQTGALVASISQQRDVVTVYIGDLRYQLEE